MNGVSVILYTWSIASTLTSEQYKWSKLLLGSSSAVKHGPLYDMTNIPSLQAPCLLSHQIIPLHTLPTRRMVFQHVGKPWVLGVVAGGAANQDAGEAGGGGGQDEEEEPLRKRMRVKRRL